MTTLELWKSFPLSKNSNLELMEQQIATNPTEWEAAGRFLLHSNLSLLAKGKHVITDQGTYASISEYQTRAEGNYEIHRKYIDVQIITKGNEYIMVAPLTKLSHNVSEYDETKDIEFFSKASVETAIEAAGVFTLLFPCDGHKPNMSIDIDHPETVKKIVIKIPIA